MKQKLLGMVLLLLACGSANAALLSRLSGQAYYDTVLDITWLANANAGAGSIYDDGFSSTDGRMSWASAQLWIISLNTGSYLGVSDWRLPTVTDTGTSGCDFAFTGTDCGYNVDLATGEMAHLFYSTLGNLAAYNTGASPTGCSGTSPYCLTNDGPFSDLQPDYYWSGTTYADTSSAWDFVFRSGQQASDDKSGTYYAWPVRPGDIDADNDGIAEAADNCTSVANLEQCDSDGDGYGNRCDGDLNNNNATNSQDYVLFRGQLGQPSDGPAYNQADINCNGAVNSQDYVLFRGLLGSPPGPSGLVP